MSTVAAVAASASMSMSSRRSLLLMTGQLSTDISMQYHTATPTPSRSIITPTPTVPTKSHARSNRRIMEFPWASPAVLSFPHIRVIQSLSMATSDVTADSFSTICRRRRATKTQPSTMLSPDQNAQLNSTPLSTILNTWTSSNIFTKRPERRDASSIWPMNGANNRTARGLAKHSTATALYPAGPVFASTTGKQNLHVRSIRHATK